ncbi:MAG: M23 family metallopeptidase [Calditrichaeota bacterium]|nr:M23 family metallopeptidase [Calditrichota bacterium]
MPKRRSDRISILIVPEDNTEPLSFRLRTRTIKLLYAVAALLVVHVVLGGVFYWKYVKLHSYNQAVIAFNTRLQEDNKRVIALADQFYALEKEYEKVRHLLGVERDRPADAAIAGKRLERIALVDDIVPAVKMDRYVGEFPKKKGSYLLTPQKSKYHDYAENLPTLLPVKGILTQDFQMDGWFGPRRHTGIDVVAKQGTVIRAAGSGTIIFASWTYDLGNLVIINHGNGIFSYYGHNQRILKPEKGYVKKGEPIALLGTSGKSSGPHLHFEIRKDGELVDPKEYILAFNESVALTK